MLRDLKKLDWILAISALLLVVVGLVSMYYVSQSGSSFVLFKKQVIFLILGFFLMLVIAYWFDLRALKRNSFLIFSLYILCLISLGLLFVFGAKIRGTTGWFKLFGITLQPIEFTKVILALLLAKYFTIRHIEMYRIRHLFISGIYVLLPSILVFFQPDLGSIIILWLGWLGIILVAEVKLKHLAGIFILGLILLLIFWGFFLKDYQKERILSFLNPRINPQGQSYQINQALIAVGSGGILGKGIEKATQTQYGFLPEAQTDFIFASLGEEFGFLGILFIFSLYFLIFWRIFKIAAGAPNNFLSLVAVSLGIMIFSQLFINIGMNIHLLPIIGVPLPFLSYGGSSLIAMFLALGILQNIKVKSA
ncbi:MAG: rod shape-determining protein RodA [Parcubacteria group bacterium CG11_big_fil_rev_8_21_14_0_20_39_14]|nr:MAG: rod shape-determining protein RodA [Parcubacteria group bacterium CG11_big_fil_rev_8_21_14_0_20_39_14]